MNDFFVKKHHKISSLCFGGETISKPTHNWLPDWSELAPGKMGLFWVKEFELIETLYSIVRTIHFWARKLARGIPANESLHQETLFDVSGSV